MKSAVAFVFPIYSQPFITSLFRRPISILRSCLLIWLGTVFLWLGLYSRSASLLRIGHWDSESRILDNAPHLLLRESDEPWVFQTIVIAASSA